MSHFIFRFFYVFIFSRILGEAAGDGAQRVRSKPITLKVRGRLPRTFHLEVL